MIKWRTETKRGAIEVDWPVWVPIFTEKDVVGWDPLFNWTRVRDLALDVFGAFLGSMVAAAVTDVRVFRAECDGTESVRVWFESWNEVMRSLGYTEVVDY